MSFDLSQYTDFLTGSIDFVGQEKATTILTKLLNFFTVLAVVIGLLYQNILYTVYAFGAGLIVCCLAVGPPYGFYNKNNLQYLEVKNKVYGGPSVSDVKIDYKG